MCTLRLRAARRDEARLLSELALRSKGYWGYDQAFLDACRAELTLAPEEVDTRRVTVAKATAGSSASTRPPGEPPEGTLADLFVAPVGSVPSGSIPGRFIPLLEVPIVEVEER